MRAAIYARFSSEHQHDRSIDDQARLCRERAQDLGATVVETFTDYAISGASRLNRPGLEALLAAARTGAIDLVIAEALDRLSRDQEDTAHIHKRLAFAGVRLVTLAEGDVDELHVGLKGTMNALALRDLAAKTKRGMRGKIEAGRSAGGVSYGYRVVRRLVDGEVERGVRAIDPDQAAIVRRIFADYLAGEPLLAIAAALNAEGVAPPRGTAWSVSTIGGRRDRQNGILHNPLYDGRLLFNRTTTIKDPDTGRRISRPNPPDQWLERHVPELRIVDAATWAAVQDRRRINATRPREAQRRPRRPLSGLLYCGVCGARYILFDRGRLACSARRHKGTCTNGTTIAAAKVEARVLAGLKTHLLAPDVVDAFVTTYRAEVAKHRRRETRRDVGVARRLGEAERASARLVEAIERGEVEGKAAVAPVLRRLDALEREATELRAELATIERTADVVDLHPNLGALYARVVEDLETTLAGDAGLTADAGAILRTIVERIELHPTGRGQVEIVLTGHLAAVLAATDAARDCGLTVAEGTRVASYPTPPVVVNF